MSIVALWGHLLAAALYGVLALWQLRNWRGEQHVRPLITAFAVMSVWSIFMALLGPFHFLSQLADSGRHLAFLAFMYGLMSGGEGDRRQRPVKAVYAVVSAVIALQIVLAGLLGRFAAEPALMSALISTSQMIGLAIAAGALVLVHNVYGQAAPESRGPIRLPMAALAVMWFYDLHLYTAAYLSRDVPVELYELRGAVLALLVPLFALAMRRSARLKVQLSRAATFQSLSVLAILAYLIVMMSASRAVELAGGDWLRIAEIAMLVGMSAAALILLPSAKARRWLNVILQKHLFQHRYDYRQEWLRFTATIGGGEAPLEQRVVKAMADIGGSPAGLLLIRRSDDRLAPRGSWNWAEAPDGLAGDCSGLVELLEATSYIIDFPSVQAGELAVGGRTARLPALLAALPEAWVGIPLIHCGRLLGLVVIAHPPVRRPLDWEDYDLFRAAGRQAASYIAEAQSLDELAQARRFDEFNRRFAFILHDIKNLVSQLSLVARNAERHADNPEFRADMVVTLQSSVRKMNDLLARLAPGAKGRNEVSPRAVTLQPVLAGVAEAKRRVHPVRLSGDARVAALADPAALEQAVAHLVQNAIDASPAGEPVEISFGEDSRGVTIEVRDRGCGMAADFVAGRLFQPFVSTKESGFGIGAHEARALVEAMNGRIEVESRPGAGTLFIIRLQRAALAAPHEPERISA
ncbi:MAG TPA: XrtA/PEP-CTERM system histidine kinase PrsK [Allosphingosinicella sp.]